jgi:uroporphyrinogen decarboxylase
MVCDWYCAYFERLLAESGNQIDLVFTADDLGGQEGPLMSPAMWERFVKPRHERLNRRIHDHGARVIYHSDGAVMEFVDGLIDMGIDILQALQFDAKGMDPKALKERYGSELCFEGGVSVQRTLPFGTVDDVVAEVESLIDTLGSDGGYILGPSHAIQAGTPPANIEAMFETALSYKPKPAECGT